MCVRVYVCGVHMGAVQHEKRKYSSVTDFISFSRSVFSCDLPSLHDFKETLKILTAMVFSLVFLFCIILDIITAVQLKSNLSLMKKAVSLYISAF